MKIQVTGGPQPNSISVTGGQPSRILDVGGGSVFSVNGKTGSVEITYEDVGAEPAGGGGRALTYRTVAAAGAPSRIRDAADYVCDGVADQVQIQQAIDDAQAEGGGIVQLSQGSFNISATITINGTVDENDPKTVTLRGCGQQVTEITAASGVYGITISNWAQVHISDLCIFISGSGRGIVSAGVTSGDTLSFWHSSFKNLRINGGFVGTSNTYGMWLDMPWRSVFENIEIEGTRNGIQLINNSAVQNAGDCTFNRIFVEIVGTDGYGLYVDSIDGNMNQNDWIMFEAGANGAACTGIYLGGTAGTASQRFYGLNLEQFKTGIEVANGESNEFYCNYVTCDSGQSGNKMFVCGTNSYNNTFSAKWINIESSGSCKVIEDNNTTSNTPNIFERIRIENNTSGTVTFSKQTSTVLRDITTFNTGNAMPAGLLQYPLSTANNPTAMPADQGLITWTHDPATCRSTGDNITSGTIYLCKVKIVDRATVVSNVLLSILNTPTSMTSGQNFVGLYDSSGNRLAVSADQSANWTSAGLKTVALTSPQTLAVGSYYVAILMVSTGTVPQLLQGNGASASALNAGLTVGTARFINTAAGNTSLPSSITLASQSTNAGSRWVALT